MNKRPYDEPHGSYKKHKHKHNDYHRSDINQKSQADYAGAVERLPQAECQKTRVPAFVPFQVKSGLPELPPLSPQYAEAPFRHKSAYGYDRSSSAGDITYERLEFLGDAYLEVIASRLIYHHYPQLTAGQQSQLRELLVKNETLAEYARAYGFDNKLQMDMIPVAPPQGGKGNKGVNKILGDSFEAYVAAIVLDDVEDGFAIAEKWLTALWAPKLLNAARQNNVSLVQGKTDSMTYDPTAKSTLQRRIFGPGIKLEYKSYQDSIELKGDQLGQNRHFIGVYLTGYGHEDRLLGQGEGKNKVEAGNWAASRAMHGEHKASIEKWEAQLLAAREAKKKAQAEAAAANAQG